MSESEFMPHYSDNLNTFTTGGFFRLLSLLALLRLPLRG